MESRSYFIGINGIQTPSQVGEIAAFFQDLAKDGSIKIFITNDTLDLDSLSDDNTLEITKEIFEEAVKYNLTPVLHYTFKHTSEPLKDIELIREKLLFVKYIQLDDLKKDRVAVLKELAIEYFVIYPLSDDDFDLLLNDEEFVRIMIDKKFSILLDNSCGKGIRESADKYKEKISKLLEKGITNIALAGGFGPDYMDTYFEMLEAFKINISIDAASKLCTDEVFDVEKAKRFVANAVARKYL